MTVPFCDPGVYKTVHCLVCLFKLTTASERYGRGKVLNLRAKIGFGLFSELPSHSRQHGAWLVEFDKDVSGVRAGNEYLVSLGKAPVMKPFSFENDSSTIVGLGDRQGSQITFHCVYIKRGYI